MLGIITLLGASALVLPQLASPPPAAPAELPSSLVHRPSGARAAYRVFVSRDGKALNCRAAVTSGIPAADTKVCAELQQARFTPAKDATGQVTNGEVTVPLTWKAEGVSTAVFSPAVDITLQHMPTGAPERPLAQLAQAVDGAGKVQECRVAESTGVPALDAVACKAGAPARIDTVKGADTVQSLEVGFAAYAKLILKRDGLYKALGDAGPYFPERALRMHVGGYAVLSCKADPAGVLSECSIREEVPDTFAFGVAAKRMAETRWMKVEPGSGPEVRVRVDFPKVGDFRLP